MTRADFYNICGLVKEAADMAVPLEGNPAPEAGSQIVQGMTNNSTYNPMSVGSGVYASPADAMALAKAKEQAAMALAKQACELREYAEKTAAMYGYRY